MNITYKYLPPDKNDPSNLQGHDYYEFNVNKMLKNIKTFRKINFIKLLRTNSSIIANEERYFKNI